LILASANRPWPAPAAGVQTGPQARPPGPGLDPRRGRRHARAAEACSCRLPGCWAGQRVFV